MIDERELLDAVATAAAEVLRCVVSTNPAADAAMAALVLSLTNLELWRIHGAEVTGVPTRFKTCERCGAGFFFAELPTGSWIPLELDQVDARLVLPTQRYVVDWRWAHPKVTAMVAKAEGQVYVNHIETCGAGDGPRHAITAYLRRYQVNVERLDVGQVDAAITDLQEQYRQLGGGDADK